MFWNGSAEIKFKDNEEEGMKEGRKETACGNEMSRVSPCPLTNRIKNITWSFINTDHDATVRLTRLPEEQLIVFCSCGQTTTTTIPSQTLWLWKHSAVCMQKQYLTVNNKPTNAFKPEVNEYQSINQPILRLALASDWSERLQNSTNNNNNKSDWTNLIVCSCDRNSWTRLTGLGRMLAAKISLKYTEWNIIFI